MKTLAAVILLTCMVTFSGLCQVQTITVNSNNVPFQNIRSGGILTVSTGSVATLKSAVGTGLDFLIISGQTTMQVDYATNSPANKPIVIAGPATIQIQQNGSYEPGGFATFSVEPGPYPPGKAVTVGAYSGNVQVTMEMSTDLVNWTTAVNAAVYTNSPDARFFRIKLVTSMSP